MVGHRDRPQDETGSVLDVLDIGVVVEHVADKGVFGFLSSDARRITPVAAISDDNDGASLHENGLILVADRVALAQAVLHDWVGAE